MATITKYAEEMNTTDGKIKVVFLNADGIRLVRGFDSEYLAEKFLKKLRYSKCTLVSYIKYA